jgi:hypothetical protein
MEGSLLHLSRRSSRREDGQVRLPVREVAIGRATRGEQPEMSAYAFKYWAWCGTARMEARANGSMCWAGSSIPGRNTGNPARRESGCGRRPRGWTRFQWVEADSCLSSRRGPGELEARPRWLMEKRGSRRGGDCSNPTGRPPPNMAVSRQAHRRADRHILCGSVCQRRSPFQRPSWAAADRV